MITIEVDGRKVELPFEKEPKGVSAFQKRYFTDDELGIPYINYYFSNGWIGVVSEKQMKHVHICPSGECSLTDIINAYGLYIKDWVTEVHPFLPSYQGMDRLERFVHWADGKVEKV